MTICLKPSILYYMKINLEDRLVQELDSIFDNERKTQVEWDVCIEDIVEEHIARHKGTWEELYCEEDAASDEIEEIYEGLKDSPKNQTITRAPFDAWTLRNRTNRGQGQ